MCGGRGGNEGGFVGWGEDGFEAVEVALGVENVLDGVWSDGAVVVGGVVGGFCGWCLGLVGAVKEVVGVGEGDPGCIGYVG
ncbi:Uncharacterised protein [Dermatophilus congolensis]|uniref:Uncharacterized protein n=1 Tax=Dermatophilus congolensis TaxID=1863 RepID=A0AA46BQ95_9MICO|nr:Uncharacterised protein [Dermatophilus congolensis]